MARQIDVAYVKKKIIKDLFLSTIRGKVEIQAPVVRDWLFNWDSRVLLIDRTWPKGCTDDMLFILCLLEYCAVYNTVPCTELWRVLNSAVYTTVPCTILPGTQRCHVQRCRIQHRITVYNNVPCATMRRIQHCPVYNTAVHTTVPCTQRCCVQHYIVYNTVPCATLCSDTTLGCVQHCAVIKHCAVYHSAPCTKLCCVQHCAACNTQPCTTMCRAGFDRQLNFRTIFESILVYRCPLHVIVPTSWNDRLLSLSDDRDWLIFVGRLWRGVEVCPNEALDELHRRRKHTSGPFQHAPNSKVFPVRLALPEDRVFQQRSGSSGLQEQEATDIHRGVWHNIPVFASYHV